MDKIGRRQLLKGGAGGALALGTLAAASPASAAVGDGLHIHVHGNLVGYGDTPSTVRLAVSFDVFGSGR